MNAYSYNGLENYCYPNTDILVNKLNIKNDKELSIAERDITTFKLAKLFQLPVPKIFDFALYCNIHKSILEDIYSWAGQIRSGEFLSKGVSIFCRALYCNPMQKKYLVTLQMIHTFVI